MESKETGADKEEGANYVYILKCSDGSLYTGWTTNLQKRVAAHNKGIASKCTRTRLPVELVYSERLGSKSEALKREAAIKKLKRRDKLSLMTERGIIEAADFDREIQPFRLPDRENNENGGNGENGGSDGDGKESRVDG